MYIDMFLCGTETVIILVKEVVLIVNPVGARESIVKERKVSSIKFGTDLAIFIDGL